MMRLYYFIRDLLRGEDRSLLADAFVSEDLPLLSEHDVVVLRSSRRYGSAFMVVLILSVFLSFVSLQLAVVLLIITSLASILFLTGSFKGKVLEMNAAGVLFKGRLYKWEIVTDAYFRILETDGRYMLVFEIYDQSFDLFIDSLNLSPKEIGHAVACFRERRFLESTG